MVQVTELGYMGLGVKDLEAWKNFATALVGLELAEEGERDRCYLRMDYWHHRLVLHADGSDDLAYLGFRVAGAEEFAEMQQQLSAAGIKYRVGSADEAAERRVLAVLKLTDPDGTPVEIFHGPEVQASKPFHRGAGCMGGSRPARADWATVLSVRKMSRLLIVSITCWECVAASNIRFAWVSVSSPPSSCIVMSVSIQSPSASRDPSGASII